MGAPAKVKQGGDVTDKKAIAKKVEELTWL
jgi:hypothetical protein